MTPLYWTLQAAHCTTGQLVTIVHPTGHTLYYRRVSDYFTPDWPHSITGQSVTILHPIGHTVLQERQWVFYTLQATQYCRRVSDYFALYRLYRSTVKLFRGDINLSPMIARHMRAQPGGTNSPKEKINKLNKLNSPKELWPSFMAADDSCSISCFILNGGSAKWWWFVMSIYQFQTVNIYHGLVF